MRRWKCGGRSCLMSGLWPLRNWIFFSSRRRHTRCYRDWSSDVCSSDLCASSALWFRHISTTVKWFARTVCCRTSKRRLPSSLRLASAKIGRASCRERVSGLAAVVEKLSDAALEVRWEKLLDVRLVAIKELDFFFKQKTAYEMLP